MNDNLEGFLPIRFHVHLILNRLRNARALRELTESKKIESDENAQPNEQREKDSKDKREYVETRLRELRAWEKRIAGGGKR